MNSELCKTVSIQRIETVLLFAQKQKTHPKLIE